MTNRKLSIFLLTGLLLSCTASAQDTGVKAAVAVSIQQDQDVWAGQQVTLNLDLKTTGFSFSDAYFSLPEVGNALLMQTDSNTIKLTEKTAGQDWQILRYPLALFPLQAGTIEIPPIDVRFSSSAGYGTDKKPFEFLTETLTLNVKLPPGVNKGALLVTTGSLELEHQWQPESEIVKTGDAFTLTVKRRAADISAMLLPPLPVFASDGLAAYPQTPEITDKSVRGDLVGERIDSVTWVVEKPGSYKIPGIRFQWWDPQTRELKQQLVPGIEFDANASSQHNIIEPAGKTEMTNSFKILNWLVAIFVSLAVIALWFRFRPKFRANPAASEKTAFHDLQKACNSNHAVETYSAVHAWLAHCSFGSGNSDRAVTLESFARSMQDEQLALEMVKLQQAMVSPAGDWNGEKLLGRLKNTRQKLKMQKAVALKPGLAPLNPT